jgi:ribosomal protein L11 methyltransferase
LSKFALEQVKESFAIVVANLTAETIIDLASELQKKVSPEGYLVLSGILEPRAGEVLREFSPHVFVLVRQKRQKEWATLLLGKKG